MPPTSQKNTTDTAIKPSYNCVSEVGVVCADETTSNTEQTDRAAIQFFSDAPTVRVPKIDLALITLRLPAFHTSIYQPAPTAAWPEGPMFDPRYPPATPKRPRPIARLTASPQRNSAPLGLRLAVISLFGIFLLTVAGFIIVYARPNLVRSLRNMISHPVVAVITPKSHFESLGGFRYSVPTASYTIVFDISRPCWVVVHQLGSDTTLFTATLQPTKTPQSVTVTGNTSLEIAARANAIIVRHGLQSLGVIHNPVVGATYMFNSRPGTTPAGTATP